MPASSLIVGVDLAPIKPIPRVITIQGDITTDKCRASISQHLKTWKVDTVLHDGAPNVGTAWVQDAFSQAELVLKSLKLATDFLVEGGTFVTKVFRSKDYNNLLWVFNQLFTKVEATKPPSSRNVSAEIFVVCRGFKAPKRIDPRFLDPRSVFAELTDPTPNNEAKVFRPEIKKRKRDGYEEGDYIQFKEAPVSEFVQTKDPIAMLGRLNRLSFEQAPDGDVALAAIDQSPETTVEVRQCCVDLRVLGRRDFRILLKWRLSLREKFGLGPKKQEKQDEVEGTTEITPLDDELRMQEELERLGEQESSRKKRARRKDNEKKQKEITRMQLNMTAPMDIGLEQAGPDGVDAIFTLRDVDRVGAVGKIAKGKMGVIIKTGDRDGDQAGLIHHDSDSESQSDHAEDDLERELDAMYEEYQAYKSEADAKFRARKARKDHEDGEWHGFSASNSDNSDDNDDDDESVLEDDQDETSEATSNDEHDGKLLRSYGSSHHSSKGLSRRAEIFFEQDIFKDMQGLEFEAIGQSRPADEALERKPGNAESAAATASPANDVTGRETGEDDSTTVTTTQRRAKRVKGDSMPASDSDDELVRSDALPVGAETGDDGERPWDEPEEPVKAGRFDIDIITAEAMTLAQKVASGELTKQQLVDDGFNKFTFRDTDGLPEWFLDDEQRHSKPHRPITAAGAAAIKEKIRALNARPIKKVREAKDRKRFKAAQRLEKLRKKSALLADDTDLTEKDKAQSISRMMSRAVKRKPKEKVKLVVATGGNRGIPGRPRGVKGKYKIVDKRLKKDVRAEKRSAKKRR